jgi:hypothetical protein
VSAPAELVWRAERQRPQDPTDGIGGGQGTSFAVALTAGVARCGCRITGATRCGPWRGDFALSQPEVEAIFRAVGRIDGEGGHIGTGYRARS